jgi:hypothetical protein
MLATQLSSDHDDETKLLDIFRLYLKPLAMIRRMSDVSDDKPNSHTPEREQPFTAHGRCWRDGELHPLACSMATTAVRKLFERVTNPLL